MPGWHPMTRCVDAAAPTKTQVQDFYRSTFTRLVLLHMLHPDWTTAHVEGYLTGEGQDPAELHTMLGAWGTTLADLWQRTGEFAERNTEGLLAIMTGPHA